MKNFLLFFALLISTFSFSQTWVKVGNGVDKSIYGHAIVGNDLYVITFIYPNGSFTQREYTLQKWDGISWDILWSETLIFPNINGIPVPREIINYNNELYGYFMELGTSQQTSIRKFNGTTWDVIGTSDVHSNNEEVQMEVFGSNLIITGRFSSMDGVSANGIASWDGSTWSALGSGVNEEIIDIEASGNNLYALGNFSMAGGIPVEGVAKWDGTSWTATSNGPIIQNHPSAYIRSKGKVRILNNELYVCGWFIEGPWGSTVSIADTALRYDGNIGWTAIGTQNPIPQYNFFEVFNNKLAFFHNRGWHNSYELGFWDGYNWEYMVVNDALIDTMFPLEIIVYQNELYVAGEIYDTNYAEIGIVKLDGVVAGQQDINPTIEDILVYPNPASNLVVIEIEQSNTAELILSDLSGKTILKKQLSEPRSEIDVSSFSKGLYFVSIHTSEKVYTKKLVVD